MKSPEIPIKDAANAALFSSVSRGLKWAPWLNNYIVGNNNVPDGWHWHRNTAAPTDIEWLSFDGNPEHKEVLTRKFEPLARVAIQRAEVESYMDRDSLARCAVTLKAGKAMLSGALAEHVTFMPHEEDEDLLVATAGIGGGTLTIRPSMLLVSENRLILLDSAEHDGVMDRGDVPHAHLRAVA